MSSGAAIALAIFITLIVLIILVYVLFQKSVLPRNVARIVSKLYYYPTLPITITRNYFCGQHWNRVDSHVLIGAVPIASLGHVKELHKQGVRYVINLMDENEGPISEYKKCDPPIQQLYLPTIDHTEPTLEDLSAAVDFIKTHIQEAEDEQKQKKNTNNSDNSNTNENDDLIPKVYVHCKGGHGRAAAVVFCWLLYSQRLTPDECQRRLNVIRHVRKGLKDQENINLYFQQLPVVQK